MKRFRAAGPALRLLVGTLVGAAATISGCANYAVTFNDRPVYTPPPLFVDYEVADRRLKVCIDQTIADRRITSATALKQLSCSYGGIESLAGIELFTGLRRLGLSSNRLTDLTPLATLTQLVHLDVSENRLTAAAPLLSLLRLEYLDVSKNPNLPCGDLRQLTGSLNGEFILPQHCR
ncbi:leucine-rich repeat domain-containing protein [Exilibacterium tricleocarpae]|nr:leucine-rich repeat domain-containing protein [Exilibacterium tricleocarpae]